MSEIRGDSGDAIRLREKRGEGETTRWGMLLVVFMRLIAGLWMVQGLAQWQLLLMIDGILFDSVTTPVGVAVVFFAVMDLVAAVGLWLATPWGGVLWLLIAFSQILAAIALPNFFEGGRLVVFLDIILVALYLFLTFKAANEFDIAQGNAPAAVPREQQRKKQVTSLLSTFRNRRK